jgi:hypothetical protein
LHGGYIAVVASREGRQVGGVGVVVKVFRERLPLIPVSQPFFFLYSQISIDLH